MNKDSESSDPYDPKPSLWELHSTGLTAAAVFVATVLLTVVSFPPFNVPEFAYAFAAPAVLWAYRRPAFKLFAWTVLGANAVAWIVILSWLHHVTWVGTALLGSIVGLWIGVWYLAAWWLMPRLPGRGILARITAVFGLAALWVLIEWTRTWLLSGFPWLTLSVSQWQRVSILQIAAYTGGAGVSFVLIAMNTAFAAYAHRLLFEGKPGLGRRSQEFFACLFLLVVCVPLHVQETFNRYRFTVPLGRIAMVQPYIPQSVKWDNSEAQSILGIIEKSTLSAARSRPDLVLLPEATTPFAIKGDEQIRTWTESLVKKAKVPVMLGSMAVENAGSPSEAWYNGAFYVTPSSGLQPAYYAKRHLVPFGEFVPFRPILGWLEKVVPVGGDFQPGLSPQPIVVSMKGRAVPFGPLICYEDIFPQLAVESVRAGAEVLVVLTNDAWYGESAAATQHAAHSVIRAIETRRSVIRCGNNGWSGWIDEFGCIRAVVADDDGRIFVRANGTIEVTRDFRWVGKQSFYVMHGDWFILVCLALTALAYAVARVERPKE
ncbi:MAG: apolipoprotein N-acyltransferase [Opitutaceae bacterium]